MSESNFGVVGGLIVIAVYLLPCIVADYTKAKNKPIIWILNIVFGWSIIGWVIPLVLAFSWRQDQVAVLQSNGTYRMERPGKRVPTPEEAAETKKQLDDFLNFKK